MKIKNKLSLLFTLLTATILLVFAAIIYFSSARSREAEFYKSLRKEAITKANLYFNAKVDTLTLQTIYKNNREILNEVEVAIYDTSFHLLYHDAADIDFVKENRPMIDAVRKYRILNFYQHDWQVVGIEYSYNQNHYIVVATAYDQHGYRKMHNLGRTIFWVFICSMMLIYWAGTFLSRKALAPIVDMNVKAQEISATNLHLRLDDKGRDELAELAGTFNVMLQKLEHSFGAQKEFVSHISHELRTPLSTIITELQIAGNKERSLDEYKLVIHHALNDAQKLAKLSNSLLDFAKASYDTAEITFKELRLDEALLDAQNLVRSANPGFSISLSYEHESEEEVLMRGNEYLLKTAFVNLMENACKFSADKHCSITLAIGPDAFSLKFADKGIGISEADQKLIFTPFFRGKNKSFADGNGIGLSLTRKIIELHHGTIFLQSELGKGSVFQVVLPFRGA